MERLKTTLSVIAFVVVFVFCYCVIVVAIDVGEATQRAVNMEELE
jgi:hypothetical protein